MEEVQEVTTVHPKHVVKTTRVVNPPIDEAPQHALKTKKTIFRFYQVVWYVLSIVEVLLTFRIIFKAIGANPFSGFVAFIYSLTDPLVLPFQSIIPSSVTSGNIIEWSTLIAIGVYAILAYGLVELLQFIKPVSQEEVEQTVDAV